MKVYCSVDGMNNVPAKFRNELIVVTQSNWQEIYQYLEGKTCMIRMYVHAKAPIERFLKMFEEYNGDMIVYSAAEATSVVLSRFTTLANRKEFKLKEFPELTDNEKTLKNIRHFVMGK